MREEDVLALFEEAGAIARGHFVLSSGLHSPTFLRKNLVFMRPEWTSQLGAALADRLRAFGDVDLVVTPAIGGLLPAYEVARHLGVPMIYLEREGGRFVFRRGFTVPRGIRVAIVEDVVTTGQVSAQVIGEVRGHGGQVVCVGYVVDRSREPLALDVPSAALLKYSAPLYAAGAVPAELARLPVEAPGSGHPANAI